MSVRQALPEDERPELADCACVTEDLFNARVKAQHSVPASEAAAREQNQELALGAARDPADSWRVRRAQYLQRPAGHP